MLSGGHPSHRVRVAIAQDGPPLYFCDRCGAYAQTRPRGLLWECPPEAEITPQGRDYLRRIAKGRHPYHNSLIGGVSRVLWPRGAPRSRPGGSCARDTVHVPVALTPPVGADAMPESVQTSGGGGLSVEPAGANPTEPESVDWWEIARRKRLCNDLPFSIRAAFKRAHHNCLVQTSPKRLRQGFAFDDSQASLASEDSYVGEPGP